MVKQKKSKKAQKLPAYFVLYTFLLTEILLTEILLTVMFETILSNLCVTKDFSILFDLPMLKLFSIFLLKLKAKANPYKLHDKDALLVFEIKKICFKNEAKCL